MKIKKSELKQIIQEELEAVIGLDRDRPAERRGREAFRRSRRADRKIDRQVGRAERGLDRAAGKAAYQAQRADQKAGKQAAKAARFAGRQDARALRTGAPPPSAQKFMSDYAATTPSAGEPEISFEPQGIGDIKVEPQARTLTPDSYTTRGPSGAPVDVGWEADDPDAQIAPTRKRPPGWSPAGDQEAAASAPDEQERAAHDLKTGHDPRMRPVDRSDPSTWEEPPSESSRQTAISTRRKKGQSPLVDDSPEEYEKKLQARSIGFEEGLIKQMVQETLQAVLDEAGGTWDPVQAKEKRHKARHGIPDYGPGTGDITQHYFDPEGEEEAAVTTHRQPTRSANIPTRYFGDPERARPARGRRDPNSAATEWSPDEEAEDPSAYDLATQKRTRQEGLINQMVQEALQAVLAERNR